jgi:hypothetical protein
LTLLRPDDFRQDIVNVLGDNSTLTLAVADEKDGTFLTYTPEGNKQFRNFTWGWTSNHLGTEATVGEFPKKDEPVAAAEPSASDKLKSMMGGKSKDEKPKLKLKQPDEKKERPPGIHLVPDAKKTDTAPPQATGAMLKPLPEGMRRDQAGALWYRPPKSVPNERNALKSDYIDKCGYYPKGEAGEGIKRRPEILVAKEVAAKYGAVLPSLKAEGPVSAVGEKLKAAQEKKNTEPEHVKPNNSPPTTVPIREAEEPILNAAQKSTFENWYLSDEVQKVIGSDSKEIMTKEQMEEVEKKFPTFTELLGMSGWQDVFGWPYHVILDGIKKNPNAFAIGFMNLCVAVNRDAKPVEKPADKQVEVPSEQPEAPPAEKKTIGQRLKLKIPARKAHGM